MRLRNQNILSLTIFSTLIMVIFASVVVTSQQTAQLNSQEKIAQDIQIRAGNLQYLANDYFLYQENPSLTLWQTEFNLLTEDLSKLVINNLDQQTILDSMKSHAQLLNSRWSDVKNYLEDASRNISVRVLPQFQTIWSRMTLQNQALIFETQQLLQIFRTQINQLNSTSLIMILAILGLFGAYFITYYMITFRNTLRSISKLQSGIKEIGLGNLDYILKSDNKDEIGEISGSINQMTKNLKTVMASKSDLEREISERRKAEQERLGLLEKLQQEKDKLSSLVNSMTDEVWYADTNRKVSLVNTSAIKEFKLDTLNKEDVEGIASSFEIYFADGSPRPVEQAPPLRALEGEIITDEEEIVKTPASGELRYRQVNAAPVKDTQGSIIGSVTVVRDITKLKLLQKKLEKYAQDLEGLVSERTKQLKDTERLAAIGATAGMVGHDIRNPLQAIISDVYLVKSELASISDSEEKKCALESLDEIEKNIAYINKIVQDLQDFARPINAAVQQTDLKSILEDLLLKSVIPRSIKANYEVDADAMFVMADPELLKRAIGNLVSNAVQAMPGGGRLSIRAKRNQREILIEVQDTGVGIPEEVKSKLFTPLFTTKSKGQGFGLAVVKRVTESMKGTVTFESHPGKGTVFIIRLPSPGTD